MFVTRTFRPRIELLENRDCPSASVFPDISATALNSTQVQLNWAPLAGATSYTVEEWDGTRETFGPNLDATTLSYTVNQLAPLHAYDFRIEAFTPAGAVFSGWSLVTTLPDPLGAPLNVQAGAATDTQLKLTWSPASGATSYQILEYVGSTWTQIGACDQASKPSFTVGGLSPGTAYYFDVEALNATNSQMSAVATGITKAPPLSAPANMKVQVSGANLLLSWKNSPGNTGYRVYRWDQGSNVTTLLGTLPANSTSYLDTQVQAGVQYSYYVQAFNADTYANSAEVSGTIPGGETLKAPADFSGQVAGTGSVLLHWNAAAGASGYRIYMWTGINWEWMNTVAQGTEQDLIKKLATNRTYWFFVQAFSDDAANVADSAVIFVNT